MLVSSIFAVLLLVTSILLVILLRKENHVYNKQNTVKFMTRVAIFGAISALLYVIPFLNFNLPFFPSFLNIHFDEVPAFIAGFAFGPFAGFGAIVVKTIIKLPFTSTLGVGEFADLIFSSVYVVTASYIYSKSKNIKGLVLGLSISTILQVIVAVLGNVYLMIPFYTFVMGWSSEYLLKVCQLANPSITDIGWSYGFYAILPFNLLKDALVIIVTILVYSKLKQIIVKKE